MLPFRKIVFPIDYSDSSKAAVPYVTEMAQRFNAQITLVHAYGPEALAYSELAYADSRLPAEAHAGSERCLREFALRMFPSIHVEIAVGHGEPASFIHRVIKRDQADLVMLPTQGRGPMRRMLLGSVTAKLLHDVSSAIWTATPTALSPPIHHGYKSILCACSLEDRNDTEAVLRAGTTLARAYDATLSIVHNMDPVPVTMAIDYTSLRRDIEDAAHMQMRELKASLGIDAPHHITEGFVSTTIQKEAIRTQADLIIVGRGHDQGTLTRLWSHLYSIVREAPCPVISI